MTAASSPGKAGASALWPVYVAIFGAGVMMGTSIPIVPLALEARGVDRLTNGLSGAMWSVGLLVFGAYIPRWAERLGAVKLIWIALGVSAAIQLVQGLTLDLPVWALLILWTALRFVQGATVGIPWLVTEIWINLVVEERKRAQALALYSTLIAGGLAAGPLVLQLVGVTGMAPFVACAVLTLAVGLPMLFARDAPRIEPEAGGRLKDTVWLAPVAMLAALTAGTGETVVFMFLPVYGVEIGIDAKTATLWQTAFVAGNLVLQLPIGWLADRLPRLGVLLSCVLASATAAAILPFLGASPWTMWPLLVIWGGVAFGIYTVGLTMLGQRFAAGDMARANAAFVMTYTFGSLIGPPVSGAAMDVFGGRGLGWSLAAAYCLCALAMVVMHRRRG
ncbi:MAG: MFS transporter [Alphaproteobacteria bacterium]|nr:MFS transporter [Alphaproteobacteria bacterium]